MAFTSPPFPTLFPASTELIMARQPVAHSLERATRFMMDRKRKSVLSAERDSAPLCFLLCCGDGKTGAWEWAVQWTEASCTRVWLLDVYRNVLVLFCLLPSTYQRTPLLIRFTLSVKKGEYCVIENEKGLEQLEKSVCRVCEVVVRWTCL